MTDIPVKRPDVEDYGIDRNTFGWSEHGLSVEVNHITDDGKCELYFYHQNGDAKPVLMHWGGANFLSSTYLREFTKALATRLPMPLDWQTLLTIISRLTMQHLRQVPALENMNTMPPTMKVEYQLYPILVKGEPTTIYGPGGFGKSTLADFIAVLVQFNIAAFNWTPCAGNVLYLDWEANLLRHQQCIQAIKKGLDVDDPDPIRYQFCDHDLVTIAKSIRKQIEDNKIDLVIIDSQMAATAQPRPGTDAATTASAYYNVLRSFHCTTLTIDHTTKTGMSDEAESDTAYGSVVKYNRSRNQYLIKRTQEPGSNSIDLALVHKKFNYGMLRKPVGIRIEYKNLDDAIVEIRVKGCTLTDNPVLARTVSLTDRLIALMRSGPCLMPQFLEELEGQKEKSIRKALERGVERGLFNKDGESWNLRAY